MSETSTMSIEDKIVKSSFHIRQELPYYSIAYVSLPKIPRDDIETMGVSEDSIVYNPKFIESLSIEQLNFTNMHEIMHIIFKHVARGKNRDAKLWNIAADLIVNGFIVNELNAYTPKKDSFYPGQTVTVGNRMNVEFLKGALFCSSLDLETDTVERIYNSLYSQAEKNGYLADKNNIAMYQNQECKKYHFTIEGTKNILDKTSELYKFRKFEMDITTKYHIGSGNGNGDTFSNTDGQSWSMQGNFDLCDDGCSKEESEQKSDKVLYKIKTKAELDGVKNIGNCGGNILIELEKALESKFDWKKYVQKYCIQLQSKDTSFLRPDKRMMYQDAIYPGQCSISEDALIGIKVCIDTSGSISEKDFAYFMGQIKSLLNRYKVDAEVIYWDAEVQSAGNFSDYEQLRKIEASGRGGTNVSCVFEYLRSKNCKVKPILTIIFTDGFFNMDFEENKKNTKLLKDTLWIMTSQYRQEFNPKYGRVGIPEFPD